MQIKDSIVNVCHKVYQNKFVAAYDGNISVRGSESSFFITKSAKNKGEVSCDDILEIDLKGDVINGIGKPSTEYKIHALAYQERDDVNAVVHCHPIYTSAFSVTDSKLNTEILPEVYLNLGNIAECEYATPSTEEVAQSMMPYISDHNVFILKNHGAVAFGKDIWEAYFRMEKLEHFAQTLFIAKQLGGIRNIKENKLEELKTVARTVYGMKI